MDKGRLLIATAAVGVMSIVIVAVIVSRRGPDPTGFDGTQAAPPATAPAESKKPAVELETPVDARTLEVALPEAPTPAPTPTEAAVPTYDEKAWQAEMSKKSLEELIAASEMASAEYQEKSQPELQRYYDAGIHEYMGAEQKWSGKDASGKELDESLVYSVVMPPGSGMYLVTLPKEKFPELYRLRAQSVWLRKEVHKRSQGKH